MKLSISLAYQIPSLVCKGRNERVSVEQSVHEAIEVTIVSELAAHASPVFDRILWICGIDKEHRWVTNKIMEDLEPLCRQETINLHVHYPSSGAELVLFSCTVFRPC